MAPTVEQVAAVRALLPTPSDNGWDEDSKIIARWANTVYRTVREYWVDKVNETAGYIDLSNEGLPANQLWTNAKAMLEYWDRIIAESEAAGSGVYGRPVRSSFSRKIKRV